MDFADGFVVHRLSKQNFLNVIDFLIDWEKIASLLNQHENGLFSDYKGISLFKALLIQTFYDLSYRKLEDHLNDSISANHFCGFSLGDKIRDHSTLSRFRNHLNEANLWDSLLDIVKDCSIEIKIRPLNNYNNR